MPYSLLSQHFPFSVQSGIFYNLKCQRLCKFYKAARPPLGPKVQRNTNVQLGNRGLPYLSHLQLQLQLQLQALSSWFLKPSRSWSKMITIPYVAALATYFSYGLLFVFGHIRDLFRKITGCFSSNNLQARLRLILFHLLLFLFSFLLYLCVCVNGPFFVSMKCFLWIRVTLQFA